MSYDRRVSDAKETVTGMLMNLQDPNSRFTILDVARSVDDLNKAWDELTSCLVRQREARDREIASLLNQLAEARK